MLELEDLGGSRNQIDLLLSTTGVYEIEHFPILIATRICKVLSS